MPIWSTRTRPTLEASLASGRPPRLKSLALALAVALEATEHETSACCWLHDRMSTPPAPAGDLILYRIAQDALANVCTHARAANVTVTLLERAGTHVVRVADDGVGFSQAAGGSPAMGCGLGIMRSRARLAGGGLRVESVPGRGTVVEAWLPAPGSGAAVAGAAAEAVIGVLIAEDDGQVRQALADMVAAEPSMEVVAAVADAAEAIAAARRFQPAVALLDVRMPGEGLPLRAASRTARRRRACSASRPSAIARASWRCSRPAPTAIS